MIRIASDPDLEFDREAGPDGELGPDRDLERRVLTFLLGHKMPALRRIDVEADGGTVTLRGEVASFYQKQLCILCSRRVAGVIRLVDEVQVAGPK